MHACACCAQAQPQPGRGYGGRGPARGGPGPASKWQAGSQDVREGAFRRPQAPQQQPQRQQPRQGQQQNNGGRQAPEAFPSLGGSRPASSVPSTSPGSSLKVATQAVCPSNYTFPFLCFIPSPHDLNVYFFEQRNWC